MLSSIIILSLLIAISLLVVTIGADNNNPYECKSNLQKAELRKVISDLQRSVTLLRRLESDVQCGTTSSSPDNRSDVQELRRQGYRCSNGLGWHKLYVEERNWSRSRRNCERDGGHLAVLNSEEEAQVLANWLKEAGLYIAFIGVHDQFEESDWLTVHGESINKTGYARWQDGLPNNHLYYNGSEVTANCGTITLAGELADTYCLKKYPYFCEHTLPANCF